MRDSVLDRPLFARLGSLGAYLEAAVAKRYNINVCCKSMGPAVNASSLPHDCLAICFLIACDAYAL